MLQQPVFSLFVRLIPEAFIFIYSIYLLTNSKFDMKRVILSNIIICTVVFVARLLPVHFGVHTIISIMLYIIIAVKLNNIEMHKAIATVLSLHILLFISDLILVVVYTKVFLFSSEIVLGKTLLANIAGMPSLVIFYLIVKLIVYLKKKRNVYEQS